MYRRKSSSEMNNADLRTETTPNIYGTGAGNKHAGNGIPLDERPNNPVLGSPYMHLSHSSPAQVYEVIHKSRPGNAVVLA